MPLASARPTGAPHRSPGRASRPACRSTHSKRSSRLPAYSIRSPARPSRRMRAPDAALRSALFGDEHSRRTADGAKHRRPAASQRDRAVGPRLVERPVEWKIIHDSIKRSVRGDRLSCPRQCLFRAATAVAFRPKQRLACPAPQSHSVRAWVGAQQWCPPVAGGVGPEGYAEKDIAAGTSIRYDAHEL
eukprot:7389122-Prymnesium_polylepis.2